MRVLQRQRAEAAGLAVHHSELATVQERIAESRNDPGAFFANVLRPSPWTDTEGRARTLRRWQIDANEQIRQRIAEGEKRLKVHVRTCWGAGKDWWLAGLVLWWITTRRDARGLTMAQSWSGVADLLWPEIAAHYNRSLLPTIEFGRMLMTEFVVASEGEQGRPTWYAKGGSSDRPSKLEGHHSPTAALRAMDEASGIDDPFFDQTEGMLDAPEILDVWISTPGIRSGRFFERDESGGADVIRIVVTKDDLIADGVPGQAAAAKDLEHTLRADPQLLGSRRNAQYMEQVEGALFPFAWIERAMAQTWTVDLPPTLGTDVAGSTDGDETTCYSSRGPDEHGRYEIRFEGAWHERDTALSKGRGIDIVRRIGAKLWRVDVVGLGKGLKDQAAHDLASEGVKAEDYRASDAASDTVRFLNRKAEDSWFFRELLEAGRLRLPASQILKSQTSKIRDEINPQGRHRIIDPADSPDHFDGALIALAGPGKKRPAGWGFLAMGEAVKK